MNGFFYLTPKQEIILLCSRFELNNTQKERLLLLLKKPLNWNVMLEMAENNRVSGFLYKHFKNKSISTLIPDTIINETRDQYLKNFGTNAIHLLYLKKFLIEFEKSEIPVIILKGGVLLTILYEDFGLKSMVDIDILYRHEDTQKIHDIAIKLGFLKAIPKTRENIHKKFHYNHAYIRRDCSIVSKFEFHWKLTGLNLKLDLETKELWQDTVEFNFMGVKSRALSLENQFIHLIIHTVQDCFKSGLLSLCEINEFYKKFKNTMDIPKFVHNVKRFGANKMAYYALYHTEKLFGTTFDNDLLTQLKPHLITSIILERGFYLSVFMNKGYMSNHLPLIFLIKIFLFKKMVNILKFRILGRLLFKNSTSNSRLNLPKTMVHEK